MCIRDRKKSDKEDLVPLLLTPLMEKAIEALILNNLEEGILKDKILLKLVQRFDLTQEQAASYFSRFAGKQAEGY